MRWCLLVFLFAPLGMGAEVSPEDAVKKDLQLFQGPWKALSIQEDDGLRTSDAEIQGIRLVIEGNKFTLTDKRDILTGTFVLNPAGALKTIDVFLTLKDGGPIRLLGIYRIQGDLCKSYFALPEQERPTQFSSEKGIFGFEWRRN